MNEVTILTGTYPKMSETFILNQVIGLMKEGWKVNTISLTRPDFSKIQPDYVKYNCEEFLTIIDIPNSMGKRFIKAIFIFLKLLFICPIKVTKALHPRYTTASKSLKNIYMLNRYRNRKIPILHANFGPNGLLGAYLKDIGIVEKLVVTFHGSDINSYPKRFGENVYKTLYHSADVISANTKFTSDKVIKNGASPDKITIIPVGLLCENFPVSEDPGQNMQKSILTVGRLVEKKGHYWMIKAMKEIIKEDKNVIWHVIGSGPKTNELKQLVSDEELDLYIHFHGALDSKHVANKMKESHIFVLPSVTASTGDMEGQGLVLQEAQSMALPVVSTLHNGIPDGILDGESGYLVEEKDYISLSRVILQLLNNRELRINMGTKGAKFVRNNYDIPILSRRWINIYRSITFSNLSDHEKS